MAGVAPGRCCPLLLLITVIPGFMLWGATCYFGMMHMDEKLKGNEQIETAILALQQNATQELFAHALTVIRRRMQAGGQLVIAVQPGAAAAQMDLKTVKTADGRLWWYAFTSFEEETKGAEQVQSTFLADMAPLFDAACTVPEISGIILNPWNRTLMLDKTLLKIIKPDNRPN